MKASLEFDGGANRLVLSVDGVPIGTIDPKHKELAQALCEASVPKKTLTSAVVELADRLADTEPPAPPPKKTRKRKSTKGKAS